MQLAALARGNETLTNSPVPLLLAPLGLRPPASLLPVHSRRVDARCSPFSHPAPPRQRGRSWLSRARRVELYWTGFFVSHRCILGEGGKKGEFRPSQRLSATVDPATSTPPKIPAPSLPRRQGSSALDVGSSPSFPAHSFSPSSCPRDTALLPWTLYNTAAVFCPPLLYPIALACATRGARTVWLYPGLHAPHTSTPRQLCGQHVPSFAHSGRKIQGHHSVATPPKLSLPGL